LDKVIVGRARDPKDDNRLGYAMHIPWRKYRVKMSPQQWAMVRTTLSLKHLIILPEKEYGHFLKSRRQRRRR
jgi:hypothetical protein